MTKPTKADLIARYGEPDDMSEDGPTNNRMAYMANVALWSFAQECSSYTKSDLNNDEAIVELTGDLICDLLHLVTSVGADAEETIETAMHHFQCEVGNGYDN